MSTALNTFVNLTGDTMSGSITFNANGLGLMWPNNARLITTGVNQLQLTAGTFIVEGALTTTGTASIAGTVSVRNAGNAGMVQLIPGDVSVSGYTAFFTPEGQRRGYIGYGSGNVLHFAAENGYAWRFDQTLSGALGVNVSGQGATALYVHSPNGANQYSPSVSWERVGGSRLGDIRCFWDGYQGYGGTQSHMEFWHGMGGYGYQRFMWNPTLASNDFTFAGTCRAPAFTQTSDISLKTNVSDIVMNDALRAFDSLRPVRYRHARERVADPLSATGYVEKATPLSDDPRLLWGFIANEIETSAPDIVTTSEGKKGYDIAQLLVIAVAKIKELEARLKEAGL
jgi:hypothetical protein